MDERVFFSRSMSKCVVPLEPLDDNTRRVTNRGADYLVSKPLSVDSKRRSFSLGDVQKCAQDYPRQRELSQTRAQKL
jgi:hypothetical protein